jgi:hypothetical protein
VFWVFKLERIPCADNKDLTISCTIAWPLHVERYRDILMHIYDSKYTSCDSNRWCDAIALFENFYLPWLAGFVCARVPVFLFQDLSDNGRIRCTTINVCNFRLCNKLLTCLVLLSLFEHAKNMHYNMLVFILSEESDINKTGNDARVNIEPNFADR